MTADEGGRNRRRLESWKEIADYLGRTERTAQRYAALKGLPVHRIGGGVKERVFAWADEVDQWYATQTASKQSEVAEDDTNDKMPESGDRISDPPDVPASGGGTLPWEAEIARSTTATPSNTEGEPPARSSIIQAGRRNILKLVIPAAGLTLVAAFGLFIVLKTVNHQIHALQMEGQRLTTLDGEGKVLWEHDFDEPLVQEWSEQRRMAETWKPGQERLSAIQDLDGDGRSEVLVLTGSEEPALIPWAIRCLSADGDPLWTYRPGEALPYPNETIDKVWKINFFLLDDLDRDGRPEIVVNAHHHMFYPAKVAVLRSSGRIAGQYYNSGLVNRVCLWDMDGDGRKELFCGGINNGYNQAALFVLDPREPAGSFPQPDTPEYRCPGLPPGREKFYLLLPRDSVNRALRPFGELKDILFSNGEIICRCPSYADPFPAGAFLFMFNSKLELLRVEGSSEWVAIHHYLESKGTLDRPFDEAALRALPPVRYWDGTRFVTTPTMNRYWVGRR